MATYNGAAHVREQLDSILEQLAEHDELIVVDDCSLDDTRQIVRSVEDARVRVLESAENVGHVRTFERGLEIVEGEFVVLSDQDDVWCPGRLEALIRELEDGDLVVSNFETFPRSGVHESSPLISARVVGSELSNLIGIFAGSAPYFGSTMAFRSKLLAVALPFPASVEAHDLWIAIVGNVSGRVVHTPMFTVLRRLHDKNLTPTRRRPARLVFRSRLRFAEQVVRASGRASRINGPHAFLGRKR